jgi:hypothetical protein
MVTHSGARFVVTTGDNRPAQGTDPAALALVHVEDLLVVAVVRPSAARPVRGQLAGLRAVDRDDFHTATRFPDDGRASVGPGGALPRRMGRGRGARRHPQLVTGDLHEQGVAPPPLYRLRSRHYN